MLAPPDLFPVPGPKACVRAGGRLAPRGPASSEPTQATGGCRAEGWASGLVNPAGAVAISRQSRAHGPLTEAAVNAMQLGVHEQERGGVASMLGLPPLFRVPGPTAYVLVGVCLVPRGPVSSEPSQAACGRRAEGWAPGLVNLSGTVAISRQ